MVHLKQQFLATFEIAPEHSQPTNCSHGQDDVFEHVLLSVDMCEPCFQREGLVEASVFFSYVKGIASQLLNSSSCGFTHSIGNLCLQLKRIGSISSRCFSSSKVETRRAMPGLSGPVFVPHGEHFWLAFQDPNTRSEDLLEDSSVLKLKYPVSIKSNHKFANSVAST